MVEGALDNLVGPGAEAPGEDAAPAQAGGGEPVEARTQGEQTWTVQRRQVVDGEWGGWDDVAVVTVAPRTKRKTIIEKALAENPGAAPDKETVGKVAFRVLDVDSAAEIPVGWDVPPAPEPELVIG